MSSHVYRCDHCEARVLSVGPPQRCDRCGGRMTNRALIGS